MEKKISVIGTGYVGLTAGVGFSKKGNHVTCMDIDNDRINKIKSGEIPIYEPKIKNILKESINKNLFEATTNLDYAIKNSDISFICVPTPTKDNGEQDTSFVETISKRIGKCLKNKANYHVIVVKSTVIPGTTENIVIPNVVRFSRKKAGQDFGICMNPEFMREGSALDDFLEPDRIVIGEFDKRSGNDLYEIYNKFNKPIIRTTIKTAEMIKYVSNSFLATKISFSNEIGNICKQFGINFYEVIDGVSLDKRISPHFLNAGVGFGGSCFPKDVKALVKEAENTGYNPKLLKSILNLNETQPYILINLLKRRLGGSLKGKEIAILGLSFKPNTDDIREAPSIKIVNKLIEDGANVRVYDPKAMDNFKRIFPNVVYSHTPKGALDGAHACLIITEWKEFENLDERDFNLMQKKIIIEGRKVLDKNINFEGVCW